MVKRNSKKQGFTLMEILISLVILMVFFMAAAKIFTIQPKRHYTTSVHGMYECYVLGDTKYKHEIIEAYEKAAESVEKCEVTPSKNVAFYNIILYKKGATEDKDNVFSDVQPAISGTLELDPANSKIITGNNEENKYTDNDEELTPMTRTDLVNHLKSNDLKSKLIDDNTITSAIIIHW